MNERLKGFLQRNEIGRISKELRELYEYIVNEEDQLADKADSVDQFLQLLVTHSPYELAASHFNMSTERVFQLMRKIEEDLHERIETRYKKSRWIDYTDYNQQTNTGVCKKYVFLFEN